MARPRYVYKVVRRRDHYGLDGKWWVDYTSVWIADRYAVRYQIDEVAKPTVPRSGLLVFSTLKAARSWVGDRRGLCILRGVAGPAIKLPPARAVCSCGAMSFQGLQLWKGNIMDRLEDGHVVMCNGWPDGTRAVAWFRPTSEVK